MVLYRQKTLRQDFWSVTQCEIQDVIHIKKIYNWATEYLKHFQSNALYNRENCVEIAPTALKQIANIANF